MRFALAVSALLGTCRPLSAAPVNGAALGLFASDASYSYEMLLREIAERQADDVLLVVPFAQDHFGATEVRFPAELRKATARAAHTATALGLRVGLMPIIEVGGDGWRGRLNPGPGLDAWFRSYTQALEALARIAEAVGAVRLGLGSELGPVEAYETHWRAVAAALRALYSGELFYAVNWDRLDEVGFWDAVDAVATSGYFPLLPAGAVASAEALDRAWDPRRERLAALARQTGKHYFFAEVGYPSHRDAAARPWAFRSEAPIDLALQATLWRAFCREFKDEPPLMGFYAWNWFGFGGPGDRSHTPRGKPAAEMLEACWRQGVGAAHRR
ncbi:MAG: hypothetical protein AAFU77_13500 [Myxococcota bacterium]